jgi:hypothetical protein
MKQGPLFRRQFFSQKPTEPPGAPENGAGSEYVRLHGHASNPGAVLHRAQIKLAPGGVLDVIADSRGGVGLGRLSYSPGLGAALKRGEEFLTYRFALAADAPLGMRYEVICYGHDSVPPFQFEIMVTPA